MGDSPSSPGPVQTNEILPETFGDVLTAEKDIISPDASQRKHGNKAEEENSDDDMNWKLVINQDQYQAERREQFETWQRNTANRKHILLKRAGRVTNIRRMQQEIKVVRHQWGNDTALKKSIRVVHFAETGSLNRSEPVCQMEALIKQDGAKCNGSITEA